MDFPFAFAHPDTAQYLDIVVSMLQGGPFIPGVIRVNAAYAFFAFLTLKFLGSGSFSIILVQTLLSVLSCVVGSILVFRTTQSVMLSNITLLLLLLLPRGLVYEHILLGESIFVVLTICFILLTFFFLEYKFWRSLNILLLGIITGFLLLSRGQALIAVLVGLGLVASLIIQKKIRWKAVITYTIFFLMPIVLMTHLYKAANAKYNDFNGLSAAGNYNLFWITTSRYFDFESSLHADVKNSLKPYIITTNQNYRGGESWGVEGVDSRGNLFPDVDVSHMNWTEINQMLGEIAHEAILTHPMAFLYRTYWNSRDFLWGKTSLFQTADIRDLLLQGNESHFRIDTAKAWRNSIFNPLERSSQQEFGLGRIARIFPFIDYSVVATPELTTDKILQKLHPLANFRWMTIGLWFLVVVAWFNRFKFDLFLRATSVLAIGQILLTIIPANALYDRYFVAVETIIVIGSLCAAGIFIKLSRYDKIKTLVLMGLIPALGVLVYLFFFFLPLPYPMIDKNILGLSESVIIQHQRVVVGLTAAIFSISICLIPGNKLATYLRQRYG